MKRDRRKEEIKRVERKWKKNNNRKYFTERLRYMTWITLHVCVCVCVCVCVFVFVLCVCVCVCVCVDMHCHTFFYEEEVSVVYAVRTMRVCVCVCVFVCVTPHVSPSPRQAPRGGVRGKWGVLNHCLITSVSLCGGKWLYRPATCLLALPSSSLLCLP